MNDWLRELDDSPVNVKYTAPLLSVPTKLTKPLLYVREETDSQRYKMAINKLLIIAEDLEWPISDLRGWYKNDLADIASMDMEALRFVVQDYIKNIDLCRGKEYQPLSDSTPELVPVRCTDCEHFIRDPIGEGGIGDCKESIEHTKPLYPNTMRKCATYDTNSTSIHVGQGND